MTFQLQGKPALSGMFLSDVILFYLTLQLDFLDKRVTFHICVLALEISPHSKSFLLLAHLFPGPYPFICTTGQQCVLQETACFYPELYSPVLQLIFLSIGNMLYRINLPVSIISFSTTNKPPVLLFFSFNCYECHASPQCYGFLDSKEHISFNFFSSVPNLVQFVE